MAVIPAPPPHPRTGRRTFHLARDPEPRQHRHQRLVGRDRPGRPGTPHQLTREEVFVVLAGRAEVRIGDERLAPRPGDAIVVPAGMPFALAAAGDEPLRALCCLPVGGQAQLADGAPFIPPWARVSERSVPLARLFAMGYRRSSTVCTSELPAGGGPTSARRSASCCWPCATRPALLRDLPACLGTSKQAVSKLVDAMVAAGYVERDADPDDARAKLVQLSARGRRLLAAVEEVYGDLERDWAAVLGAERLAGLRGDLTAVLSANAGGGCRRCATVG